MVAVRDVDLDVSRGEFLSILGPNGAGKSSLVGMLAGVARPSRGTIRIFGSPMDDGTDWRGRVGLLSHYGFLYGHLTALENLRFYGELFGLDETRGRARDLLQRMGLGQHASLQVRTFSRGMRQRLALARTLLHDPEIVFLDEPFTGLDPTASLLLREVLTEVREELRTVVMVTHNLREARALSSKVMILVGGRIVWRGSTGDVPARDFDRHYHDCVASATTGAAA